MYHAIHLRASNDTNGNPRRCFLIYDAAGNLLGAADEGYIGDRAIGASGLLPEGATAIILARISVPVSEYREALA